MTDQWLFKSETYDNCNCAINCGCQFYLPTTYGFCQSAYVGEIVEGHFNGTPLTGLRWSAIYKWPGEIADGNGRALIVIDERADAGQRAGLETILRGESCAPFSNVFAVFASSCSEFCETRFSPIDLEVDLDGRTARAEIPGILKSTGRPKFNEFTGETFDIALARRNGSFEFTYAELCLGSTKVTGELEMAFDDTWALFVVHHFDQDGMVRDRPRLASWLGLFSRH